MTGVFSLWLFASPQASKQLYSTVIIDQMLGNIRLLCLKEMKDYRPSVSELELSLALNDRMIKAALNKHYPHQLSFTRTKSNYAYTYRIGFDCHSETPKSMSAREAQQLMN
jgi:hypothetical protein